MSRTLIVIALTTAGIAIVGSAQSGPSTRSETPAPAAQSSADAREIQKLKERIAHLEGLVPDQAAVMSHLAYHFTNLWFALQQENWTLADFYLGECRSNLKWAVRVKPVRPTSTGQNLDVEAIAQAVDGTQFARMAEAIRAKDKEQCISLYRDTTRMCYSCHMAAEKPYLRVRIPEAPEVQVIHFDPSAKPAE